MNNMSDVQSLLAGLQQQIASISSLANAPAAPIVHTPQPTQQDIAAIVRATLAEEIAKISQQTAPALPAPVAPVAQEHVVKSVDLVPVEKNEKHFEKPEEKPVAPTEGIQNAMMSGFLNQLRSAIGASMTVQQQEWLSLHLFELPGFFKSEAGRSALAKVLSDYKTYLE